MSAVELSEIDIGYLEALMVRARVATNRHASNMALVFSHDAVALDRLLTLLRQRPSSIVEDERPELPSADAGTHIPRSPELWRPIETAPKDETPVLIYRDASYPEDIVHQALWIDDGDGGDNWYISDGKKTHVLRGPDPSHWMPLPEAPLSGAARDMGSRAPQGADEGPGIDPKTFSTQPNHAPGEGQKRSVSFVEYQLDNWMKVSVENFSDGEVEVALWDEAGDPIACTPQPQTEGGAA